MGSVEQYEDCHDFTVGHSSLAVAMALAGVLNYMFFQFNLKIFTKFIEYTKISTKFAVSIGVVN